MEFLKYASGTRRIEGGKQWVSIKFVVRKESGCGSRGEFFGWYGHVIRIYSEKCMVKTRMSDYLK